MGADLPHAETATLLAEHQALVAKVKTAASEVVPSGGVTEDGVAVDDLFFLRFLLSNKLDIAKASTKAIETLNWRKTNAALLKTLANGGKHPVHDRISMSLFQGNCGKLKGGEPVSIVRMGVSDFRNLMNTFSVEEVAEYLLYEKEAVFRMCDSETRKRGYLVKSVTVIDFAHFTMFGRRFDKRFFEALGQSSKRSSVLFPQLQVKTVAINTPAYYGMVHKTLSAVMPKSSMEKMVMCPAKKTETQSASKCPFLAANGGVDQVPPFLGGTGAIPRSATPIHERTGEHPFQVVKVKSRSFAVIEMMIEQRDTMVEFEVKVDSYHVYMRAEVRTAREGDLERLLSRTTTMMSTSSDDDFPKVEMHKRGRRNRWKTSRAREVPELDRKMSMVGPPPANSKRLSLNPQLTPLKLQAKDGLVKGTWRIPVSGRLLIAFDNTFSRFRSKTVTYRILSVPTPEDEEEKSWWESNWGEFASQAKWPLAKDDDWSCVVS